MPTPTITDETPMIIVARAPVTTWLKRSSPIWSVPNRCARVGAWRGGPTFGMLGLGSGRRLQKIAAKMTRPIQEIAIQKAGPSFCRVNWLSIGAAGSDKASRWAAVSPGSARTWSAASLASAASASEALMPSSAPAATCGGSVSSSCQPMSRARRILGSSTV